MNFLFSAENQTANVGDFCPFNSPCVNVVVIKTPYQATGNSTLMTALQTSLAFCWRELEGQRGLIFTIWNSPWEFYASYLSLWLKTKFISLVSGCVWEGSVWVWPWGPLTHTLWVSTGKRGVLVHIRWRVGEKSCGGHKAYKWGNCVTVRRMKVIPHVFLFSDLSDLQRYVRFPWWLYISPLSWASSDWTGADHMVQIGPIRFFLIEFRIQSSSSLLVSICGWLRVPVPKSDTWAALHHLLAVLKQVT